MNILGFHTSFNSKTDDHLVTLIVNDQQIFVIKEERLSIIKTSIGYFPERALVIC
tara:strand:+ start:1258 stop:1422 length:165 start_codon:yes stop_codon:yes gene_type:complete